MKNQQMPLLETGGKSILNLIIKKLNQVEVLDEVYIVMNEKYSATLPIGLIKRINVLVNRF
ncbi:hypothetical protein [Ruoffia sp. FAM 26255]|uniref:hypothetical protein n=1 Tax=Ruoffia sp. FAM 26255 TaxID=3259519 RepID=UPI0038860781